MKRRSIVKRKRYYYNQIGHGQKYVTLNKLSKQLSDFTKINNRAIIKKIKCFFFCEKNK